MQIDDAWQNLEDLKNRVLSGEDIPSQDYADALDLFGHEYDKRRTVKEWCLDKWWDFQVWRNTRGND